MEKRFKKACRLGDINKIRMLLTDPKINYNFALRVASGYGHIDIIRELLAHPCIDPTDNRNWALDAACTHGYIEIIRLLLTDPRINPFVNNHWATRCAKRNGHTEIVQLLTEHMYRLDGP